MNKTVIQIIVTIVFALSLTSCLNLRYTDYGKPFDFLTAKKNVYKTSVSQLDTAEVYVHNEAAVSSQLNQINGDVINSEENIAVEGMFDSQPIILSYEVMEEKTISDSFEIAEDHSVLKNEKIIIPQQRNLKQHHKSAISQNNPPEWWSNMWKGFFKILLLGILMAIAAVVLIYAIILGVTALALWIGGPTVAAIVCIVLFIVIQLVFDIDLSWMFFLF